LNSCNQRDNHPEKPGKAILAHIRQFGTSNIRLEESYYTLRREKIYIPWLNEQQHR